MPVKKYKPVTPGTRFRQGNDYSVLSGDRPEKSLLKKMTKSGGRNHDGKMTNRHIGGGHKKRYRVIDFKRNKEGTAEVTSIQYDPNRTAFIALLQYDDGVKTYIIAPSKLAVGDKVKSGRGVSPNVGNCMFLDEIPLGSDIHAIEMAPGSGAAIARSAGTYGTLMGREGKYASVRLPSGEVRRVLLTCKATIGSASNPDHQLQVLGKAGRKRWLGKRPHTRGVAMNPVDHPMGGGEGKASGGHPRSRNGIMAKGQKTRKLRKYSDKMIISKRKSKSKK